MFVFLHFSLESFNLVGGVGGYNGQEVHFYCYVLSFVFLNFCVLICVLSAFLHFCTFAFSAFLLGKFLFSWCCWWVQ